MKTEINNMHVQQGSLFKDIQQIHGEGGGGLRRGGDGVVGDWCLTSLQEIFVSYLV